MIHFTGHKTVHVDFLTSVFKLSVRRKHHKNYNKKKQKQNKNKAWQLTHKFQTDFKYSKLYQSQVSLPCRGRRKYDTSSFARTLISRVAYSNHGRTSPTPSPPPSKSYIFFFKSNKTPYQLSLYVAINNTPLHVIQCQHVSER